MAVHLESASAWPSSEQLFEDFVRERELKPTEDVRLAFHAGVVATLSMLFDGIQTDDVAGACNALLRESEAIAGRLVSVELDGMEHH